MNHGQILDHNKRRMQLIPLCVPVSVKFTTKRCISRPSYVPDTCCVSYGRLPLTEVPGNFPFGKMFRKFLSLLGWKTDAKALQRYNAECRPTDVKMCQRNFCKSKLFFPVSVECK